MENTYFIFYIVFFSITIYPPYAWNQVDTNKIQVTLSLEIPQEINGITNRGKDRTDEWK